jgi:hypothetical protein
MNMHEKKKMIGAKKAGRQRRVAPGNSRWLAREWIKRFEALTRAPSISFAFFLPSSSSCPLVRHSL